MKKIQLDKDHAIYTKMLGFEWAEDIEFIYNKLILQHKWSHKYYDNGKYVFDISANNQKYLKPLFDIIIAEIKNTFPKAIIPEVYCKGSWAYVSNKDRNTLYFHHHLGDKVDQNLTTVFYLKKPVTQGDEGALAFKFGEEQYAYQPKEGEFVVFPASYMHSPLPIHTEEYRMAININIVTLNKYKDFL